MLKFDRFFNLLKKKGYTTYTIRKEKLISQGTYQKMKNGTGAIDSTTIERLCDKLDCQPGDLMEYVRDNEIEAK